MIRIRPVPSDRVWTDAPGSYIILVSDGEQRHFQSGPLGVVVKKIPSLGGQL